VHHECGSKPPCTAGEAESGRDKGSRPHLVGQLQVAGIHSGGGLGQGDLLEERDDVLLPEDALVLLLQVDKGVAGLAVPQVGQPSLHPQPQVIADHLRNRSASSKHANPRILVVQLITTKPPLKTLPLVGTETCSITSNPTQSIILLVGYHFSSS
jgi:hypothetical protein